MSTRDNPDASGKAGDAPAPGVNAYKMKRGGLAAPAVPAEVRPAPSQPLPPAVAAPAARPRRPARPAVLLFGVGLALAVVLGVVVIRNRGAADPSALRFPVRAAFAQTNETARPATRPDYRALVIGINQYEPDGGDGWPALNTARADAESVAGILADDYGFNVRLLLDGDASRSGILSALDDLATSGEDGADLIYFAGHGTFDDKLNEGYWIPADARRRVDGRDAKEDWLWNSTITRLIGASRARHVLVMSDACYGGALFRGDEPLRQQGGQSWYERAIVKPSRYLITSGGMEPVLDSGAGHSVFAQQVINYLLHAEQNVFSANDLGSALRERVAALTGQMVQMGPLPLSGHFGGEFVFIRKKAGVHFAPAAPPEGRDPGSLRGPDEQGETKTRPETLRNAAELLQAGAPQAAGSLVADLLREDTTDPVARAVAAAIGRTQRREERGDLQKLIEELEAKGRPDDPAPVARPRVLACLGPTLPAAGNPADEGAARLYRIVLRAELESQAGFKVIEREALAALLQEQRLGVSDLADPQARLVIGKLLPASVLLLGDVIATGEVETLYLRLVDTETTQVLASFTASRQAEEDLQAFCAGLAGKIADRITVLKPLRVPVAAGDGNRLRAALGTYHGARTNQAFAVLVRTPVGAGAAVDYQEQQVGTAIIAQTDEFSCELDAVWGAAGQPRMQNLWLREVAPGDKR